MLRLGAVLLATVFLLAIPVLCQAAPFAGRVLPFAQPDGSTVQVRLFGDELYMRGESLDGYTLVRDPDSGWLCYATLSPTRDALVSTGVRYVGGDLPAAHRGRIPTPHADISPEARRAVVEDKRLTAGGGVAPLPAPREVIGDVKGLIIVVDFSDAPATVDLSAYDRLFNDYDYTEYGNLCSMSRFYDEASGGLVSVEHEVFGIYRAAKTFAEYEAMPYGVGVKEILFDALEWVDSTGFDFSTLTTWEQGSNVYISSLYILYTGLPAVWAEGMWWHSGWYTGFSADGVSTGSYACGDANEPINVYTPVHEGGHMIFGWPDLYIYEDFDASTIRTFCIMAGFSDVLVPTVPNPYFRYTAGWIAFDDITGQTGTWTSPANDAPIYKWTNPEYPAEYFLIQARTRAGLSVGIPDEGLTIWRIDENGNNQSWPQVYGAHFQVDLMHANDAPTVMEGSTYHAGEVDAFGAGTSPSSNWWDGNESGLELHSVSAAGASMTFSIGEIDTDADAGADTDSDSDPDAGGGGAKDDGCGCSATGSTRAGSLLGVII